MDQKIPYLFVHNYSKVQAHFILSHQCNDAWNRAKVTYLGVYKCLKNYLLDLV